MTSVATGGVSAAAPAPADRSKVEQSRSALGNGLDRLVRPEGAQASAARGLNIRSKALTIRDAQGRVLVDLTPQQGVDRAAFRARAEAAGMVVQNTDATYGTLEGFIAVDAIGRLAGMKGTGTLAQALKPHTDTGSVESQGVKFQRVDKVLAAGVDGTGVTIGALSDSYDQATTDVFGNPLAIHAAQDVASGDLPGPGNPVNSEPVVVIQDSTDGYDEGRAMLQIAHDVAPKAKLCFATANGGQLNFADNIRALADSAGTCGADIVVDDVSYFDEPMFSDGVIADAVDDVADAGVSYFSSAGNQGQQNAWQSKVSLVSKSQGVKGTNLKFAGVDPALYDGGLQDARPGKGLDVAQTIELGSAGGVLDFQWDDPYDPDGPTLGASIFHDSGNLDTPTSAPTFTFTPTAGQVGQDAMFNVDGVPSGTTDVILTVTEPDGNVLGPIDTGTSPEIVTTVLQAGDYTITVEGYNGATGPFTVDVQPILAPSLVTTDFNLLFFDMQGNFLGASAGDNVLSGRPSEIISLGGPARYQMVISRSGTGPAGATQLRIVNFDDAWFTEYSDPLAPAIIGHHMAEGGSAVAAYDPFKPYLPEYFTSPGGKLTVKYDSAGNAYPSPQTRRVPAFAATDGGNTTFFVADTGRDPDSLPNFFGTSAAAPHAAAIAALVLQQRGGPGSVTPEAMRSILQQGTFAHDLDPTRSQGSAGGLTISARGPQGYERSELAGEMADARFFTVRYQGRVPITSLTLLGETASPTAAGKGMVFDSRKFRSTLGSFETVGFPFKIGGTSGGLAKASVHASYSKPAGSKGQFRHMKLTFGKGLRKGQTLLFGIDRDLATTAWGDSSEGNGADELGGATVIPQRTVIKKGLTFVATLANGKKITGRIVNKIGSGWTALDGYGLIDAQKAVLGN